MRDVFSSIGVLVTLVIGALVCVPHAGAQTEAVTSTYSPGKGIKPTLQTTRGTTVSGQQVTTGNYELREVLLPDGTSLTLAPNSEIEIDAFEYHGANGDRLTVSLSKGLVRVAGGMLNEKTPIVVKTKSGNVVVNAATAVISVSGERCVRASLLVGRSIDMTAAGEPTQTVQKPGYEAVSACGTGKAGEVVREEQGEAAKDAYQLGTAQLAGITQSGEDQLARSGIAEIAAAGVDTRALATENKPAGGYGYSGFQEVGAVNGGDGTGGFGGGLVAGAPLLAYGQPSESNGANYQIAETTGNSFTGGFGNPMRRTDSMTTNRLFNSIDPFSSPTASEAPIAVNDTDSQDTKLQYVIWTQNSVASPLFPGIELLSENNSGYRLNKGGGNLFDSNGPFMASGPLPWPKSGEVAQIDIPDAVLPNNGQRLYNGTIFKDVSHWYILQAGFSPGLRQVTSFNSTFTLNSMYRDSDNFFMVEVRPGKLDGQLPELDPTQDARFIFATGNVDAGRLTVDANGNPGAPNPNFTPTFSVDHFFISAGLENFDQKDQGATVASGIRAFLRPETSLGLPLTDSGLYVVNTTSNQPNANNPFLHTDFGMQGTGAAQQSTISLTIGNVQYVLSQCGTCDIQYSYDAVATGNTIGSSHGNVASSQWGTVAIKSPLMDTSFGGGNPQINRAGYAGYFVFENYTPADNNVDSAPLMPGGTEHALGSATSSDVNYAILRLATGTGQVSVGGRNGNRLTGWAGGIAEKENGAVSALTLMPIGTGIDPSNFVIVPNPTNNQLQVNLQLTGHAPVTLGGPGGASAYIDDNRFAAANGTVAMIDANLLRDDSGNMPASLNMPDGRPIPQYNYLQWGFFFGDTAGTAGTDLEHLHMGVWIAGREADPGQLPNSGTATYTGHSIGNVTNGNSIYTAVGTFSNQWDFGARAGVTNMNFDGTQYTGLQRMSGGVRFGGPLTSSGANRAGSIVGNFVQAADGSTPTNGPPPAMAGRFVLQETAGAPYRASGIFGGERH